MRTLLFSTLTVAATAIASMGCGSSYDCCFNKLYYSCKDQKTLDSCAAGDVAVCDRDAQKDSSKCP